MADKASREINIGPQDMQAIIDAISKNPTWLFRLPHVVHHIARMRRQATQGQYQTYGGDYAAIHDHAIGHNKSQADADIATHRSLSLIHPLTAISEVWRNASNLKVLAIGPRSEAELFNLMGYGFAPDNIKAVDLISYSELVEVGDMHALPYPDATFDVIIMGWVLAYSKDNVKAAAEAMRVLKPGGYCAVGCVCEAHLEDAYLAASQAVGGVFVTSPNEDGTEKIVSRYFNLGQLKRLFEPYNGKTFFENEPIEKYSNQRDNVILVFRKKLDALNTGTQRTPSTAGGYPPIRNIWDPA